MRIFVTAIGTDSGKTVLSAILCEALDADYWKPVQAGFPTDREQVEKWVSNPNCRYLPETYLLNTPASPHAAAPLDGLEIHMDRFKVPDYRSHLVIEGAGGVMVPLNDHDLMVDLIKKLEAQVLLVSNLYLGSINHTLLTVEVLKKRGVKPLGLVFNGESNPASERVIMDHIDYPVLLRIRPEAEINKPVIRKYAQELKSRWSNAIE